MRSRRRRSMAECETLRIMSRVSWSTALADEEDRRLEEEEEEDEDFLEVRVLEPCGAEGVEEEEVGATCGGSIRYRCGDPGAERLWLSMALVCGLNCGVVDPPKDDEEDPFLSPTGG